MHLIETAYEFGYAVSMIHRAGLYHWRFAPWMDRVNYYDGAGDHVRQILERLTDSFNRLVEHIDRDHARRIDAKIREVEKVSLGLLESFASDGKWKGVDYGIGRFPGIAACEGLALAVDGALEESPRLMAWQHIGQAVGSCSLMAAVNEGPEIPIDLEPLRVAVMALSPEIRKSIPLLNRCAKLTITRFERNASPELELLLGGKGNTESTSTTQVITQLIRLDIAFKNAIHQLTARQEARLQLHSADNHHHQAVLDGNPYEISHENYLILRSLLDAGGDRVSARQLAEKYPDVIIKDRIDRYLKELPQSIEELIDSRSGPGGGYRIPNSQAE